MSTNLVHSKKMNKIETDLFKKKTDRCQYLLPSSCHPSHICRNIPYSLAYRLVRICSTPEKLNKRLQELKELLLSRDYRPRSIDSAISRARAIPRERALERVDKKPNSQRVVFVITYDPRLPSISNIFKKHHSILIQDPSMKEIFPDPPLTAYRRPQSLRDKLIKAKILDLPNRSLRVIPGIKKYTTVSCITCPYVIPSNSV